MKKRFSMILSLLVIFSLACTCAYAAGKTNPDVTYAPATETTINGIPESNLIQPNWVSSPIFDSYSASSPGHIDFFKLIASSYVDNRSSSTPYVNKLTITQSTSQGSEWSGSVSFTGEIKAGMLGKIGTQVSGGVKESRETNEAVGASGQMTVPAYKQGRNEAYYGGMSSSGTLNYHIYDDYDGQNHYYSVPVNCKVHKKYLDVNFKPVIW
jgi:hypothetical protein